MDSNLHFFLETFKLDEIPMGTFFTEEKPKDGYSPKSIDLPTAEKEANKKVNWPAVFINFSCAIQKIWLARKKQTSAYFSAEQFGCFGAAFYFGYLNPPPNMMLQYISTGVPPAIKGELYHESPEIAGEMLKSHGPHPDSLGKYCVFKPLNHFERDEKPELVTFFVNAEALSGLHRLVTYVTNDPEAVVSPWSAACGALVGMPLRYKYEGKTRAVIGGMDPSARKFLKKDELTFTVPYGLLEKMLEKYQGSFLTTKTWKTVQKKMKRA